MVPTLFISEEKEFSLRVAADNFSADDILEGVKFAHERGKKYI